MQRGFDRQRQEPAEHVYDDERQRGAGDESDERADHGEPNHLRQVNRKYVAAGGADRLEGCDDVAPAIDMALDGIGNAHAADQQRRQSDQRQELGEAADRALELRRSVVTGADLPAGVRQRLPRIVDKPRRVAVAVYIVGQFDPVGPAHETPRLDQLRGTKPGLADQESWSESEAAGEFVRLAIVEAADLKGRTADIDAIAEFQIEPGQQRLIGGGAKGAVTFGEQVGDRHVRFERELAEHWVGGVHRLDLDQRQATVG